MSDREGNGDRDRDRLGITAGLLGMEKVAEREAETDQLNERSVGQTIGDGLSPPYPPEQLTTLLELNGTVAVGIEKKARREVGFGFDIVPADGVDPDEASEDGRETVGDFWRGSSTRWQVGPTGTPTASPTEVLQKSRKDYHTVGWLALEVLYAGTDREPVGLSHIPAATIRLKRDSEAEQRERQAGHGYVQKIDGQTRYFGEAGDRHNTALTGDSNPIFVDGTTGETYEGASPPAGFEPANELIFIRNNHPNALYYGLPDHISEIQTIVADQQAKSFNRDFFEADAIPQYLFLVEGGRLGQSEREDLRGIISQLREEEGRRAAVIEAEELAESEFGDGDVNIEIQQLTQQGDEDMSFVEYRQKNELEIAKVLEMPPQLIGRMESANRSNSRSAIRDFTETVIQPAQNRFAGRLYAVLHQQILDVDDWTVEFKTKGAEDRQREADIARTKIGPSYTVNEAREALGLDPLEELNQVLVGDAFAPQVTRLPRGENTPTE